MCHNLSTTRLPVAANKNAKNGRSFCSTYVFEDYVRRLQSFEECNFVSCFMDKFVSQIWLISQAQQMAPLVPKMQAITIQAFGCKNKQSWLISKTWHLEYFSSQGMANKQYAHISRIISKTWHLEIFCSFSREARSYWPQGN